MAKESIASIQARIDKLAIVVQTQAQEITKLRAEVQLVRKHYGDDVIDGLLPWQNG